MATEIHGEVQDDEVQDQQQDEGATGETLDADADDTAQGDERTEGDDQQAEEDGEIVITLGDVEITAPAEESVDGKPAPQWLKDLRKSDREKGKELRELKAKMAAGAQQTAAPAAEALGAEPQPEDYDYDAQEYGKALVAFTKRKEVIESTAAQAQAAQQAEEAAFNGKLAAYEAGKKKLNRVDFDDAEEVVRANLSPLQIGWLLKGSEASHALIYALGRNPEITKGLGKIKDPVEFIWKAAKINVQEKPSGTKSPPPAERQIRSGGGPTSLDSTLARLEAEADRTGNRSKVAAYRRDQRMKKSA